MGWLRKVLFNQCSSIIEWEELGTAQSSEPAHTKEAATMAVLLAGDIGGTKTILRLVERRPDSGLAPLYEFEYPSRDFADLVPMVQQFLTAAAPIAGPEAVPTTACFAIAGPVVNNTSKLTNLGWSLTADRLAQELNLLQVKLINDFAAVGYGVLGLAPTDIHTLQAGVPSPQAPIGVIGAGTGLGQGYLVHQATGYEVYPSEGGHVDFAPRTEQEFQLSRYLLEKHDIQRLSVERVVSGQGIVAIYQFLRDRQVGPESPAVGTAVEQWEREVGRAEKQVEPAAIISQAALAQSDRLSELTMDLFISAYGAEAGNLALKLLPYGGLYLAGGIAAKNLPLFQTGCFLRAFTAKGRMRELLENVPVHIILNPQVGLMGAALCAARLGG
jgi:glucokinase